MNILIAPDSFKGSLTAKEYCEVSEKAIHSLLPNAGVIKCPLADGGEGTVEALVLNTQGKIVKTQVTDPLGEEIIVEFGILGDGKTAVIEMASASGLPLVPNNKRDPFYTTTYGTGELIKKVMDYGCNKIIMGIGGSATNDGGAGMLQALGFKLLDCNGIQIQKGAIGLQDLCTIDTSDKDSRLDTTTFLVACDVNNPLIGPNGATYIYGPQKGATQEQLPILDNYLKKYAEIIKRDLNKEVSDVKGAGAAGGLGAGLLAFMNAELKSGFDIINETIYLEKLFDNHIDLVITGEGEMNYQTVNGKLPVGIATIAKKYNVPVIAIVGSIGKDAEKVYDSGIDSILSIVDGPRDLNYSLNNAKELLYKAVERLIRIIKINR